MSTTAILRWACDQFDGDINRAIDALRYHRCQAAVDVLINKRKKNLSATKFYFEPSGLIRIC